MKRFMVGVAAIALACTGTPAVAELLPEGKPVELHGPIASAGDLSAACLVGTRLVLGSDEVREVAVLTPDGDGYGKGRAIALPLPGDLPANDEVDVEGIACDGRTVYVIGSHSRARTKVKKKNTYEENLKALDTVTAQATRDSVFRFELADDGTADHMQRMTLRPLLAAKDGTLQAMLAKALEVPGKENGVDIEGLAVKDGNLYVGFRGPVLRENWVPILEVALNGDTPAITSRFFVNLGGLGIRELVRVQDGFLLIAGPVGDGPGDFHLYRWNGTDGLKSPDDPKAAVRDLGTFHLPAKSQRPEGLAVMKETDEAWDLLVVYDDEDAKKDQKTARATRITVAKKL